MRRFRLFGVLLLLSVITLTISLLRGQEKIESTLTGTPPRPTPRSAPAPLVSPTKSGVRDLSRLSPLQQQFLLSGQQGADWLFRMNGIKGRFVHGYLPALKQEVQGDHYLRQAAAAATLARAARFLGEERFAARATQAILALLDDTALDGRDARVRHTTLPPVAVNRLGAAGLLVLAINELPAPQKDLLDKSEQLCAYIKRSMKKGGELVFQVEETKVIDFEGASEYPGLALLGLMRSHKFRPATWKTDLVRQAALHYRPWWRKNRSVKFVPAQTVACAEAYFVCKDKALAQFVLEMSDWVCTLQYDRIDPRRLSWYGGFMSYRDGKIETQPDIHSVAVAEGLIHACRVAEALNDTTRVQKYTEAIERCLQFAMTLQYTNARTQHFADWYRPRLVGGFHASQTDGNLRLDYSQQAVAAMLGYLEHLAK